MIAVGADQAAAGICSAVSNEHCNSAFVTGASLIVGEDNANAMEFGLMLGMGVATYRLPVPPQVKVSGTNSPAVSETHPTFQPGPYAGESIAARSTAQKFTPAERAEINRIGQATGCHTCSTTSAGTKSGNFVPDHQPPSGLVPEGTPQQLYPHCIGCSREQGLAIARLRRGI